MSKSPCRPSPALLLLLLEVAFDSCTASDDVADHGVGYLIPPFSRLPTHVFPLFVIGDVNKDNRVSARDVLLISRAIAPEGKFVDQGFGSCVAADVDLNGMVNDEDRTLVSYWVAQEQPPVNALIALPAPYTRFGNSLVAAELQSIEGSAATVHFVSPHLCRNNVEESVEPRGTTIRWSQEGDSFNVIPGVRSPAALITVKLRTRRDGDFSIAIPVVETPKATEIRRRRQT